MRTYNSRVTRFQDWCTPRKISICSASLADISSFLKQIFDEGKQVSTIRNYRSAIAAIHTGFADGSFLGNNVLISQLL
ncbi:site-specific integrase [Salmonella sp. s55004]|uniref:site-specific integrase n=1 Tax=Salmonella sp. s55004 TaxID=3159675 RepID=UPI00397F1864